MQLTGPETLLRFDKRMAAATDGLRDGLNWGELVNAGGSPAPLLALHTSHPTDQVNFMPHFMLLHLKPDQQKSEGFGQTLIKLTVPMSW